MSDETKSEVMSPESQAALDKAGAESDEKHPDTLDAQGEDHEPQASAPTPPAPAAPTGHFKITDKSEVGLLNGYVHFDGAPPLWIEWPTLWLELEIGRSVPYDSLVDHIAKLKSGERSYETPPDAADVDPETAS